MKKCVCELCNCGRHRCPHKPTSLYGKGNATTCDLTEYSERFPVYTGLYNPPNSMKPKPEIDTDKKRMDGTTTFKTDFIAHEVTRRQGRQPAEYRPNPEKIDLGTTYNKDFNPYEFSQPSFAVRPKDMTHSMDKHKMVTIPSYKDDFKQWEIHRQPLIKPKYSYRPPTCKFGGPTTFQDDFIHGGAMAQRASFKPPNVVQSTSIPMESFTSNRHAFVSHVLEPRWQRPPETYKPSGQPLESLTTHRHDFQGLAGGVSASCKPKTNEYSCMAASSLPIQASTENKEQFKSWPISLRHFHKKETYVGPTEHMDMGTTMANAYVKHQIQPFIFAKAQPTAKLSSAPLENRTTMREDFPSWGVHTRQPIVRNDEMYKSRGKIEDLTTFRAHFTAHELTPNKNFKPPNQPPRSNAPMEDSTMYRSEFTPKRITVCPASFELPPGYMFEDSDDRGHKYFSKMSPKDNSLQLPPDNALAPMQSAVAVG
ncbi:unnamed protein product [Arctogadus glacialis]